MAKFISKTGKEYTTANGFTAVKPSFMKKCIHTFKCMFNPGGKECIKFAKDELNAMTKSQLELVGRDNGIELDKRKTKKALIDELYEAL